LPPEDRLAIIERMAVKNTGRSGAVARKSKRAATDKPGGAATATPAKEKGEVALRDDEVRLRAVLDTAVDGIITIDERGTIESFNLAAEKMFGFTAAEAIGRNISLLMPTPHREQHDRYLANYCDTGERKIIGIGREVSGRRKDGSAFPLELAVSEVRLGVRRIFTGIVRDITRRKQVEESLREERDFVSAVLQTAGALVIVLDDAGRVVRFNRACEQLTGYAAEEIVGKAIWDFLLPPEELADVRSVFEQLRAGQFPNHFENSWLTKAGQRRLISWSNTVMTKPDGKVKHIIGTGLDITGRKRDEQRRQMLYETSRLLAASDSLAGTIPRLLQTLAEALHWDVGEFWKASGEPATLRVVDVWHAPDQKLAAFVKHGPTLSLSMFDGLPGRVLATRKPDWIPDVAQCPHFVRKREAARAGLRSALAFPIVLDQQTLGVMAFLTHRVTVPDEDLLQIFASLGSQIGQFMERKRLENELIEISEREQRKFGRDLHDGLGQRLTGLEMLSHALAEDLKSRAPALSKQARRLNHELRETVTLARLISHNLAPVPLEGDGLMRGLMELAASTSRIPGVACRFNCDPPVCIQEVTTATHLYRIAQEAVNNALKHGKARKVDITLREGTDGLELSVENNGRIMPTPRANTGMGLSVMRYRAEMIGGNLSIESGPRNGVRVACTLRRKS
jgi:PAS domain S-box-containing protein